MAILVPLKGGPLDGQLHTPHGHGNYTCAWNADYTHYHVYGPYVQGERELRYLKDVSIEEAAFYWDGVEDTPSPQ